MPERDYLAKRTGSPIAQAIRDSVTCEKLYCTTCGGLTVLFRDLERIADGRTKLHEAIAAFGAGEALLLLDAPTLPPLMRQLPAGAVDDIVRTWLPTALADPRFAAMATLALHRVLAVHVRDLVRLLEAATPFLLQHEETRARVGESVPLAVRELPTLHAAIEADRERFRRAREVAYAAAEERRRAEALLRAEREAAQLAAEMAAQAAIDKRNADRLAAMATHRARLADLSVGEQLAELLSNPSIPIEHYPLELAPQVSPDVVALLEPAARRALCAEVERTPLKRWRRLLPLLLGREYIPPQGRPT